MPETTPMMQRIFMDSRVCWGLLLGYALASPFIPLTGLPISWLSITLMDWQRIIEAAVLLVTAAWLLTFSPPTAPKATTMQHAWILVFALGFASSLLMAHHIQFALLDWSWFLLLVFISASIRTWGVRSQESLDRLLLYFSLLGTLAYLWWFWRINASVYFEPAIPGLIRQVQFPGFSNIRYFSDYQSFMLLLLPTALAQLNPRGLYRHIGSALVGLYFALALLVGSRSLIAAHMILHASLLILLGRRYHHFLLSQLKFWLYGGVFFIALTWLIPLLMSHGGPASSPTTELLREESSHRSDLWLIAWQMIKEHPLLGVGPMHYADFPNPIAAHPHNLFLQFASEWGIPATLILTWLIGKDLLARVRGLSIDSSGSSQFNVSLAMTCAAIALPVQSMVAGTLNYPVTQVLALICFAYPIPTSLAHQQEKSHLLQVAGAIAMGLVILNMTMLDNLRARNLCFVQTKWPTPRFAPRFWQQGWLVGECGPGRPTVEISQGVLQQIPGRSPVQAGEP